MHCNKCLVTQPPFPPMGPDRDVFHICRLPHIFHFSISVDLRAAFIQLAALAFTLFSGPGTKPMLSRSSQTEPWFPPLNTCWLVRPGFTRPGLGLPSALSLGQVSRRLGPENSATPSIQESWGSKAWNCLPLVWSSSSSWQFSSSLAFWSPCLHLKVRVHPRPLAWIYRITMENAGRKRMPECW